MSYPALNNHASLAGIAVETVLWVINSLLVMCMSSVLRPGHRIKTICCFSMYMLATAQASLSFYRLLPGGNHYINKDTKLLVYFWGAADGIGVAQGWLFVITILIQDIILMWRLYKLSDKDHKDIPRSAALELSATFCYYLVQEGWLIVAIEDGFAQPLSKIKGTWTAYWSLTMVLNAAIPLVISSRLWLSNGTPRSLTTPHKVTLITTSLRAFLEFITVWAIATPCLFVLSSLDIITQIQVLNMMTQIATMVPLVLVFRGALRRKRECSTQQQRNTSACARATDPAATRMTEIDTTKTLDMDLLEEA